MVVEPLVVGRMFLEVEVGNLKLGSWSLEVEVGGCLPLS